MELTAMDYIRAALANAQVERLTLDDVIRAAEYASTPRTFDHAVNELVQTEPEPIVWDD